jgi:hypothetical protein
MDKKTRTRVIAWGVQVTVLVCALIAGCALAYQRSSSGEKPSAADWMQGWGTIYGLVATTIAAIVAGGVYFETVKAAREAEANRKADDREALLLAPRAVLVTRIGPGMQDKRKLRDVEVSIQNFGSQPVRRISAMVTVNNFLAGPTATQIGVRVPLLAPGEAQSRTWNCKDQPIEVPVDEAPVWDLDTDPTFWSVTINFIDAAGRAWNRVDNGEPFQVPTHVLPG